MPEFVLPGRDEPAFQEQDDFTKGYIEAMFFTSTGSVDDGDLKDASVLDLSKEAWERIQVDCKAFQQVAGETLVEALDNGRINGYDARRAGNDFWYTRNGHGTGFWDRDLAEVGADLAALCGWRTNWPEQTLYKGDNGQLYLQEG